MLPLAISLPYFETRLSSWRTFLKVLNQATAVVMKVVSAVRPKHVTRLVLRIMIIANGDRDQKMSCLQSHLVLPYRDVLFSYKACKPLEPPREAVMLSTTVELFDAVLTGECSRLTSDSTPTTVA